MTEEKSTDEANAHREAYAIVGELVLIANAIDDQLNKLLVEVLDLGSSAMTIPVVATLDPQRKIEILKERAKFIPNADWKSGLKKHIDRVERVFKQRNIVCHMTLVLEDGAWLLRPTAAAKLLKNLDLTTQQLRHFPVREFRDEIQKAEEALGEGGKLISSFQRLNKELESRRRKTR
ncbi:hypothetical protein ACJ4V0_07275 [Phreatobacter sp. HK31-P]